MYSFFPGLKFERFAQVTEFMQKSMKKGIVVREKDDPLFPIINFSNIPLNNNALLPNLKQIMFPIQNGQKSENFKGVGKSFRVLC